MTGHVISQDAIDQLKQANALFTKALNDLVSANTQSENAHKAVEIKQAELDQAKAAYEAAQEKVAEFIAEVKAALLQMAEAGGQL